MSRLTFSARMATLVTLACLLLGGCNHKAGSNMPSAAVDMDDSNPHAASGESLGIKSAAALSRTISSPVPAQPVQMPEGSGQKLASSQEAGVATASVPSIAMRNPGVAQEASRELLRISQELGRALAETTDVAKRKAASAKAHAALDQLYSNFYQSPDYPNTGAFIVERRLKLYLEDVGNELPSATQELDDFVAGLQAVEPNSEATATAIGARLFHTKIEAGEPNAEKEQMIIRYIEAYPGKNYVDQIVYRYGTMLGRSEGAKARLKWFEKQLDYLSPSAAASIQRELTRSKLIGSFAELSGPQIDGTNFDLASKRGKVVLVDFWATWCGPCVAELPEVKEVFHEFREQGFEVVGFSLDRSREALDEFLEKHDYDWTHIYTPQAELRNTISESFGVTGIPANYLIDQTGKITAINLRGKEDIAEVVSRLLNRSVAEKTELGVQTVDSIGRFSGEQGRQ